MTYPRICCTVTHPGRPWGLNESGEKGLAVTAVKDWVSTFGTRVRELRQARGWSQESLAARAGRSQSAIRDVERGGRAEDYEPHPNTILGIARAFGEDGIELLHEVGKGGMAEYLDENDHDPLDGLPPQDRRRVLEIARQIVDMGRGTQDGDK